MKILLSGGGTAGHAWPTILVAKSLLNNHRVKILYVGSRQGIEKELVKKYPIPFKAIVVGKRRTYFSVSNFWDIFKIFCGIVQSFFIIIFFKPNVVFAKGGFVTFPIIFWSRIFKIPLVIHESDVVMGKANLWASCFAKKICLGFPLSEYKQNLPRDLSIYTGTPVAEDFLKTPIKSGTRPKILFTGGSQGASKINELVLGILPDLTKKYEIWHLTGERDFKNFSGIEDQNYHPMSFSNQMPQLMRDADLVISRAGAQTLAEISATGKASILIPLEAAAYEHQQANASVYQRQNAAVVVQEKNISSESLQSIIESLMEDEEMRNLLGHHAKSLYQPNSEREIIDILFET